MPRHQQRGHVLTTIDPLTRLATLEHFSRFLDQEWDRATRDGSPVALLMFDVDFLQGFNDIHGHEAGDDCLRRIAAVIIGRVKRASDIAARYGAEEFAVVLACAEEAGALSVAEWIRAEIEKLQIPHGASSISDYVTVSAGVAVMTPLPGEPAESLITGAETALGRAKELGRNGVIASSSATPVASR